MKKIFSLITFLLFYVLTNGQVYTQNFFGSVAPQSIITASAGIKYINTDNRTRYRQTTIPQGSNWVIEATNVFVTTDFVPQGAINKYFTGLPVSGVTAGSYTSTNLTVNAQGIITAASNGGGGGSGTVTNVSVTNGTGISASVANPTTTPNITITNTLPDQTVVLTNGTGIGITGTYPSFIITNTNPSSGGTVTNVGTGLWLSGGAITTTGTIIADSASMAAYFLRRTDSSSVYATRYFVTSQGYGTGTVTSVSGTANRITSTGGATPVIDISASYIGQASITTLGTITTGTWTGTSIAVANGGTGATTAAGARTNLGLDEGAETSSTANTATTDFTIGATNLMLFEFFTMPAGNFYLITGIEWTNGTTVAGNVICGAVLPDANPPVTAGMTRGIAYGAELAASGVGSAQRQSMIASMPIRGGTLIAVYIQTSSNAHQFKGVAVASQNRRKTITYDVGQTSGNATAWSASTTGIYIKVYYRLYN